MKFCDCDKDGWCPRYRREQVGRFRQICAGINVDLGTAAAFRAQWASEARTVTTAMVATPLLLKTDQCPGDAVVMTAAIYSLQRSHPGKYVVAVDSPYSGVFEYNPDVVAVGSLLNPAELRMHYPAIQQSNNRGIHFMQGYCEHLEEALGVRVPLLTNRPHIYFADSKPSLVEDFWVVCSGGKRDFTNKLWGTENYQKVIGRTAGKVKWVQVGDRVIDHPQLYGTNYQVGYTTLRDLFSLVRRAKGVLCGVSLLMHVAAALEKPAVVIAGGREPVVWNAYPKQHYLHTVGMLPCHDTQGNVIGACWRSRTASLGDDSVYDKDLCERPVNDTPECMTYIKPEEVADLIMRLNRV